MTYRKNALIAALQRIPGNPLVFVDIEGQLSTDVSPTLLTANEEMILRIVLSATERPALGDIVILL